MTHRVVVQRLAAMDLDAAYRWAAKNAPLTAASWLVRFERAILSLAEHPGRCALASESLRASVELRQLLFGTRPHVFRVVFTIEKDLVRVIRILRAARRGLSARQVEDALHPRDQE